MQIEVNYDSVEVLMLLEQLTPTERKIFRKYAEYQPVLDRIEKEIKSEINIYSALVNDAVASELSLNGDYHFKPYIIKFKKLKLFIKCGNRYKVAERFTNGKVSKITIVCQ